MDSREDWRGVLRDGKAAARLRKLRKEMKEDFILKVYKQVLGRAGMRTGLCTISICSRCWSLGLPTSALSPRRALQPSYTYAMYGNAYIGSSFTSHSSLTPPHSYMLQGDYISQWTTHELSSRRDSLYGQTPRGRSTAIVLVPGLRFKHVGVEGFDWLRGTHMIYNGCAGQARVNRQLPILGTRIRMIDLQTGRGRMGASVE